MTGMGEDMYAAGRNPENGERPSLTAYSALTR